MTYLNILIYAACLACLIVGTTGYIRARILVRKSQGIVAHANALYADTLKLQEEVQSIQQKVRTLIGEYETDRGR